MDVVAHRSVSGQQYAGVAKSVLHIPYIYATCTSHDYIICIFYTAKSIQYAWNIIRNCVYKASTVNILVFIAVLALYLPEFLGLRFFVSRQATFQDLDLSGPWSVDLASWIRKKTKRPKGPSFWYILGGFQCLFIDLPREVSGLWVVTAQDQKIIYTVNHSIYL